MRLGPAEVRFTGRAEGDLGHAGRWVEVHEVDPGVEARRRAVLDRPWSWLRQVHGATVVTVEGAGQGAGSEADAAVSDAPGAALCVLTADCAPIALAAAGGAIGAVHAGWRGLAAGVVGEAVAALRRLPGGGGDLVAAVGPCIGPECYEFGAADLDEVAGAIGPEVRSRTATGEPALDLRAGVRSALLAAGVASVEIDPTCTACSSAHFSHRARSEAERQATVVWVP